MKYFISRKIISKWNITIAQQSEIGDSLTLDVAQLTTFWKVSIFDFKAPG